MNFSGLKNLSFASLCYLIANGIAAATPLLLLPIYAGYLDKSEFGLLSIFTTGNILLSGLIGFGSNAALQKKYFDLSTAEFASYLRSIVAMILGWSAGCLIFMTLFSSNLVSVTGLPKNFLYAVILVATSTAVQQAALAYLQIQSRIKAYLVIQTLSITLVFALSIYFVVFTQAGMSGAIYGLSIATAIMLLPCGYILLLHQKHIVRLKYIRHAFRFGYPIFPQLFAGWAIAMFDRFLIQDLYGPVLLAGYSFAFQISQPMNLLSNSIVQALTPTVYAILKDSALGYINVLKKLFFISTAAIISVGLLLWFTATLIIPKYFSSFVEGIDYIPWMIAGLTVNGAYRLLSIVVMYYEKTLASAMVILTTAAISVGFNIHYLPTTGVRSAAIVGLASQVIIFVGILVLVLRQMKAVAIRAEMAGNLD